MISFSDLLTITMNPVQVILTLIVGLLVGLYVWFIYKKTFSGVMYSRTYGMALVMMTIVTALMLMLINNSLTLSLGMVGALSIVRFRTAIKEPLDIAFLFWAIAAGIVLAAGMIPLAVFGSVFIGMVLLVFANKKSHVVPYMVVLHCDSQDAEKHAMDFLQGKVKKCVVKSKTAQQDAVELTAEIRLADENTDFVNALSQIPGVTSAVLVSYNGDYMG